MSFLGIVAISGRSCNGFLACDVAPQLGDGFCPSAVCFTRAAPRKHPHQRLLCPPEVTQWLLGLVSTP